MMKQAGLLSAGCTSSQGQRKGLRIQLLLRIAIGSQAIPVSVHFFDEGL